MKKILVVGIVLLFLGVTIVPTINYNVVKASSENDYVKVTCEACDVKGNGNTTVRLSKQQYQELHQYLVTFRERMNQTTTKEDALNLVKNAIGELYKYGLIPKSLSIEQAKTLATRNLITKTIKPHQELTDVNLFSLVVGKLKYIDFLPAIALPFIVVKKIFNIFYELLYPLIIILAWLYYFGDISGFLLSLIYFIVLGPAILIEDLIEFFIRINRPIPISLFNSVNSMNWGEYVPEGWIDSFGMLGKESWNGSLRTIIFGFTGYKIQLEDEETFFIGSSIYMEIQPKS